MPCFFESRPDLRQAARLLAAAIALMACATVARAGEGGRLYGAADRGPDYVGRRIYGAVPPGEPYFATSFAAANGLSSYGTNRTLANRRRFVSNFSPRGSYGWYYGFYGPWYGAPYPYGYPYGYYPYGYAAFRPGPWIGGPYPYPYVGLYRGYYPPFIGSWSGCGGGAYFAAGVGGYYW